MTPAWEQTWNIGYGYEQSEPGAYVYDENGLVVASEDTLRDECAAVIACASWLGRDYSVPYCPQCGSGPDSGHRDDCAWLAFMKKAGVR